MNVYFTKWSCNGASAYKIGISKWGKDKLIEERTSLKVYKPNDPLLSIVKGAGMILDNYEQMKNVCVGWFNLIRLSKDFY